MLCSDCIISSGTQFQFVPYWWCSHWLPDYDDVWWLCEVILSLLHDSKASYKDVLGYSADLQLFINFEFIRSFLYISMDSWLHILINRIQLMFAMIHFATKNYFVDFLVGFWVLLTCPHLTLTMSLILVQQKFQVCLLFLLSSLGNHPFLVLDSPSFTQLLSSHPRISSSGASSHSVTVTKSPVLFLPFAELSFCTPSLSYSLKSLLLKFFVEQIWW